MAHHLACYTPLPLVPLSIRHHPPIYHALQRALGRTSTSRDRVSGHICGKPALDQVSRLQIHRAARVTFMIVRVIESVIAPPSLYRVSNIEWKVLCEGMSVEPEHKQTESRGLDASRHIVTRIPRA